ncbi:MAG: molybdopterin molybdotransferase MoeA [Vicinamibacterales bacterium]|nr:molybdopterin molybdotransferase MoeA [Vicinamibacterales bacterium]
MTMRPFTSTITLTEARRLIDAAVTPVTGRELVPLHEALGRVLAGDVRATGDVPPFARAGMDGYAVRASDTAGASAALPVALQLVDRVFTGQVSARAVGAGECIEIATGAPMPLGADAVVMVEDTVEHTVEDTDAGTPSGGTRIGIRAAVAPGQHVGRQGADIAAGQTVLPDGTLLNASRLGALAALGITEAPVYVRPRVAILSTGNEIVEPGEALGAGQIYDINRFTLGAVVTAHGGSAEPHRAAADTLDALLDALDACADADVVVFSGGSSVGERDLMIDALAQRGRVVFHGIAVKPGKPTAFGIVGRTLVFGMPGYPASCLSNAYILLAPVIRRLARLPAPHHPPVRATLGSGIKSVASRHQIYTVRLSGTTALPAFKASGDITSLSQADGYIEIPAGVDTLDAGTVVDVHLF